MIPDQYTTLAEFSVSEFRAFKTAFRILRRAGIGYDDAVKTLVNARNTQRMEREQTRLDNVWKAK